jgi:hypothetical protein
MRSLISKLPEVIDLLGNDVDEKLISTIETLVLGMHNQGSALAQQGL